MRCEVERRTCDHCGRVDEHDKVTIITPGPPFNGWIHLHYTKSHPTIMGGQVGFGDAVDDYDFCGEGCLQSFIATRCSTKG